MSEFRRSREATDHDLTTADLANSDEPTSKNQDSNREKQLDPAVSQLREPNADTPTIDRRNAAREVTTGSAQENQTASLFSPEESEGFHTRWDAIQVSFVDAPRQAVQQADGLVASAMKRLAEIFADERGRLDQQWDRGGDVSTEDLRIALRRYRSFFGRLLSV